MVIRGTGWISEYMRNFKRHIVHSETSIEFIRVHVNIRSETVDVYEERLE